MGVMIFMPETENLLEGVAPLAAACGEKQMVKPMINGTSRPWKQMLEMNTAFQDHGPEGTAVI